MEYTNNTALELIQPVQMEEQVSTSKPFIEANTVETNLEEIKQSHIIPVFVKDNETLISHSEFIDSTLSLASEIYYGEHILKPNVRVSHPIKGRIPDAKHKPVNQLYEWEKTLYYERMAFIIELPSIQAVVDGNLLNLTIGGVKAYNTDNLYSRTVSDQHFKIFVGFQNKVCTNLCVWSDGLMSDVRVKNLDQLKVCIRTLLESYNKNNHLDHLLSFTDYFITEHQFAQLIGRCRMYNHLPSYLRNEIPPILFGDNQMATVVKDFYRDDSFCRDSNGNINLWRLYNLFTGANKSSYIDSFLDRSVNAFSFVEQIRRGIENKSNCWYLN